MKDIKLSIIKEDINLSNQELACNDARGFECPSWLD